MKLKLYHYWRSSASWRVRWAFAIKGIVCERIPIDLLKGEQKNSDHLLRNPLGTVPVLEIIEKNGSKFLSESLAIIEWAEEIYPKSQLLPGNAYTRGRIRQLAELINSGIHPVQNRKVQLFYSKEVAEQKKWAQHWIGKGLKAYETLVGQTAGKFSFGDSVTLADLCLIPQCYNARRNDVVLADYPLINKIFENAMQTQECQSTAPEKFQPV